MGPKRPNPAPPTLWRHHSGRDLLRLQLAPRSSNAPSCDQVWGQIDPDMVFFKSLPGAEHEALTIKAVLTEAAALLREQATETALGRAEAPSFLHIVTHGFFLGDQEPFHKMMTNTPPSYHDRFC